MKWDMVHKHSSSKSKKKHSGLGARLFKTSLFIGAAFLLCIAPDIHMGLIIDRIIKPLLRLILIMSITLSISALIEGMGWSKWVARFARPIMRLGNFSDWAATAYTTAFLSGVASNTLLWNAYKEGKISFREMVLATLLNLGIPSYILHLPTAMAILVSLAGKAGMIYLALTFSAAILRTIAVLIAGRIMLKKENTRPDGRDKETDNSNPPNYGWEQVKKLLKKYLIGRLSAILVYTIPIYIAVVSLQELGFFSLLQEKTASLIALNNLPIEGMSLIVFSIMAEFTAGAATAGAMIQEGILTVKETVIALLIGNVIATPIRALRHQLPRYLGIFTPLTGTLLLLLGQTLRIVSVAIVGVLFYLFY